MVAHVSFGHGRNRSDELENKNTCNGSHRFDIELFSDCSGHPHIAASFRHGFDVSNGSSGGEDVADQGTRGAVDQTVSTIIKVCEIDDSAFRFHGRGTGWEDDTRLDRNVHQVTRARINAVPFTGWRVIEGRNQGVDLVVGVLGVPNLVFQGEAWRGSQHRSAVSGPNEASTGYSLAVDAALNESTPISRVPLPLPSQSEMEHSVHHSINIAAYALRLPDFRF